MDKLLEQRVCLKFCVSNDVSCAESVKLLQNAYRDSCVSKTQAYEWYKTIKEGREVIIDLPTSDQVLTAVNEKNIEKMKDLLLENPRIGMRELSSELSISCATVHNILTDHLDLRRIIMRIVPKELDFVQKNYRKQMAEDMLSRTSTDPTFMKRIITGGSTWVYECDRQANLGGEPKAKKMRQSESNFKIMLAVFFDYHGVVHFQFLPEGEAMNKEFYLDIMKHLREHIRQKRSNLWKNNSWILHHDNETWHKAFIVQEFLAKHSTNVIEQALYSPDMTPFDFFLFPKLKLPIRGASIDSIDDMKDVSLKEMMAVPQSAYEKCMDDWIKRWRRCVASDGAYFESHEISSEE